MGNRYHFEIILYQAVKPQVYEVGILLRDMDRICVQEKDLVIEGGQERGEIDIFKVGQYGR